MASLPPGQTGSAQNQTQLRGSTLKVAGNSSLKGTSKSLTASGELDATFKPSASAGSATMKARDHEIQKRHEIALNLMAECDKQVRKPVHESMLEEQVGGRAEPQLAKLAGRIAGMGSVFEEETRSRAQEREFMGQIHGEQVARLDEVAVEVDAAMQKLAQFVNDFKKKTMEQSRATFEDLHGDLATSFGRLAPRLAELGRRSKTLREGLEQERADRLRETAAVLAPLREQIVRLGADLEQERKIRENREAELKQQLKDYVGALDQALDVELDHRKRRHEGAVGDIDRDQVRLKLRQEAASPNAKYWSNSENGRKDYVDKLEEELEAERKKRIEGQDTMATTLTEFIKAFQKDIKEKASVV
jgi:hypothetical protein